MEINKIFITGNSGFPKSLNIGKAVDKIQGNEREITGYDTNTAPDLRDVGAMSKEATGIDKLSFGQNPRPADRKQIEITKGTSEWEGWGTALKPAHEPICMARKPLQEKTVAENVLKYGTGGINIDGCRIGTETIPEQYRGNAVNTSFMSGGFTPEHQGRFPANLIHDGSEEVLEIFPETNPSKRALMGSGGDDKGNNIYGHYKDIKTLRGHDDNGGSASRFFYCAKASKSERNFGCNNIQEDKTGHGNLGNSKGFERFDTNNNNNHPTVKPLALMRYLVKLITPKQGIVLDPFAGSGTTLISAYLEGRYFIGIEKEPEYIKIAEARIKGYSNGC